MILVCKQTCEHRDALKAQIEANRAEFERMLIQVKEGEAEKYMLTVEQLRLELKKSQRAYEEAKKMQAQQTVQLGNLKAALANETANSRNEREKKQEAIKER